MYEVYKEVWDSLRLRIRDIHEKDPFKPMLTSEVLRIMDEIENTHLREETEKLLTYLAKEEVKP